MTVGYGVWNQQNILSEELSQRDFSFSERRFLSFSPPLAPDASQLSWQQSKRAHFTAPSGPPLATATGDHASPLQPESFISLHDFLA